MSDSPLAAEPFEYSVAKSGKVLITHHGKQVKILQGKAAAKFVSVVESASTLDAQRHMAKITGQYKFGNERLAKDARN